MCLARGRCSVNIGRLDYWVSTGNREVDLFLTGLEAERREAQRRFWFLPAVLMGSRTQAGPSGLEAAAGSECRSCSAHATRQAVFLRKAGRRTPRELLRGTVTRAGPGQHLGRGGGVAGQAARCPGT